MDTQKHDVAHRFDDKPERAVYYKERSTECNEKNLNAKQLMNYVNFHSAK